MEDLRGLWTSLPGSLAMLGSVGSSRPKNSQRPTSSRWNRTLVRSVNTGRHASLRSTPDSGENSSITWTASSVLVMEGELTGIVQRGRLVSGREGKGRERAGDDFADDRRVPLSRAMQVGLERVEGHA